jgi:hypothetical protein
LAANRGGVAILVGLVTLFGILALLPEAAGATVRPDGATMFDAMTSAQQPRWLLMLNPVFGVIGVLIGAKLEGSGAS